MSAQQPDIREVASRNTNTGKVAQSWCVSLCEKDVTIFGYNNGEDHLFTLEVIFQHAIRHKIHEKEEFETNTLSAILLKNASYFMFLNVIYTG